MSVRPHAFVLRACLVAGGLAGLAAAAHAQSTPLQPGLWEEATTIKSDNAQMNAAMADMQAKLAAMPPDKRQMVEQMMAAHGGGMNGSAHTDRVCMTKEQIAHDMVPDSSNGRCSHQRVSQSGNVSNFTFTCTGSHPVNGQGTFTLNSPQSFNVATDTNIVMREGAPPSHVHSEVAGRFVSSDCGNVKPMKGMGGAQ